MKSNNAIADRLFYYGSLTEQLEKKKDKMTGFEKQFLAETIVSIEMFAQKVQINAVVKPGDIERLRGGLLAELYSKYCLGEEKKTYLLADTDTKLEIVRVMRMYGGSFILALAECIVYADNNNLRKIEDTFSEYVRNYYNIKQKGL